MTMHLSGKDSLMTSEAETEPPVDKAAVQAKAKKLIANSESRDDFLAIISASASILCALAHDDPEPRAHLEALVDEFVANVRMRFASGFEAMGQCEAVQ